MIERRARGRVLFLWLPLLVAVWALILSGCAGVNTVVQKVPVPVPCEVPDIPQPPLPIDSVAPDADIFVVDRALWASLEVIEGYVGQLRAAAEGCRSK